MKLIKNDPRTELLRELYRSRGCTSLVINRAANLCWLLGGRCQIGIAGDYGVCTAVVNDNGVVVVTNNIEGARLACEEFGNVPLIHTAPWYDPEALSRIVGSAAGAKPLKDTDCEKAMQKMRMVLLPQQQLEAEEVCSKAAHAISSAAVQVRPGMTEFEVSGILSKESVSLGLIPNVLFTPSDERIKLWRHAISTEKKIENIVMLSLGAHYNGLYCSITRFVSFGEPDKETLRSQEVACRVAASMYTKTVPGKRFGDLFTDLKGAYLEAGAPEQFEYHHQGGLGGYQTREVRIDTTSEGEVYSGQLFAWNPSAPGFKSEDMLLVGKEENRILTFTPEFEYKQFACEGKVWRLPQILIV